MKEVGMRRPTASYDTRSPAGHRRLAHSEIPRGRQTPASSNGISPDEQREELAAVLRAMDLPKEKVDALLLIATS